MNRSASNITNCTHFRVRKLSRAVTRLYDAELAPIGIKTTQFSLLAHLAQVEPISPSDLASLMAMDASTLTRNLRPLLNKGWATQRMGADSRQRLVSLTTAGASALEEARKCWGIAQSRMAALLGGDDLVALNAMLDRVQGKLRASR